MKKAANATPDVSDGPDEKEAIADYLARGGKVQSLPAFMPHVPPKPFAIKGARSVKGRGK